MLLIFKLVSFPFIQYPDGVGGPGFPGQPATYPPAAGYPPAGPGYPPAAGGYPPAGPAYPQGGAGYPPAAGGYPGQPPYGGGKLSVATKSFHPTHPIY